MSARRAGPYELRERLGSGGNADVWVGVAPGAKPVAVKQMRPKADPERLARFRREVELMQLLQGEPGILPLLDAGEDPRPWYSMPVAEPIAQALAAADLATAVGALADFAATLARIAERGVHHRDIKPANLYRYEGRWVVGDFGLGEMPDTEAITKEGRRMGPANFLPYELIVSPHSAAGGPVDVYEIAKTLWVLAAGRPFAPLGHQVADGSEYTLYGLLGGARARDLDRLIDRCTRTAPGQRPRMEEVASELRAWLQAAAPQPPPLQLTPALEELRAAFGPELTDAQLRREARERARALAAEARAGMLERGRALMEALPGIVEIDDHVPIMETVLGDQRIDQIPDPVYRDMTVVAVSPRSGIADPELLVAVGVQLNADTSIAVRAAIYFDRPGIDWGEGGRVFDVTEPVASIAAANAVAEALAAIDARLPDALTRLRQLHGS